ncbi:MAG: PilN domain-containing protein [Bacillota bacterium]
MKVRISLLPEKYKPKKQFYMLNFLILLGAFLVAGYLAWDFYNGMIAVENKKREVEELESKITMFAGRLAECREAKARLKKVDEYLQMKDNMIRNTLDVPYIMNHIKTIMPVDVWMTSLIITKEGKITMNFQTKSLNAVGNTIIMFNRSNFFDKNTSSFTGVTSGGNEVYTFSLSYNLLIKRGNIQ